MTIITQQEFAPVHPRTPLLTRLLDALIVVIVGAAILTFGWVTNKPMGLTAVYALVAMLTMALINWGPDAFARLAEMEDDE